MLIGNFDLQMGEKEGYHLVAPTSYWAATGAEILAHTGGCGPGKFGDYFVPDTVYGETVFLACQIHDWMYFKGLTLQDKRTADICLLVNMVLLVDDGELLDRARCYRCILYYLAVSNHGESAFLAGKEGFKDGYEVSWPVGDGPMTEDDLEVV